METALYVLGGWCVLAAVLGPIVGRWLRRRRFEDAHPCECGHPFIGHQHYREGSDCGRCGPEVCPRFRPSFGAGRKG